MGELLTTAPGYAICPRCSRRFAFDARECDQCRRSVFPGGPRLPVRLWRKVPRTDGSIQILLPEQVPLRYYETHKSKVIARINESRGQKKVEVDIS